MKTGECYLQFDEDFKAIYFISGITEDYYIKALDICWDRLGIEVTSDTDWEEDYVFGDFGDRKLVPLSLYENAKKLMWDYVALAQEQIKEHLLNVDYTEQLPGQSYTDGSYVYKLVEQINGDEWKFDWLWCNDEEFYPVFFKGDKLNLSKVFKRCKSVDNAIWDIMDKLYKELCGKLDAMCMVYWDK